ncbi:MAG: DUF192 domain-containing protein, partial [Rhodospirillales bacterium]|nr:DUF192 domain-containing protein [Rhodospirillales bacterium]
MIARGIKRVVFAALLAGAVSPAVADEVELKVVTDKGRFIFSVEVAETAAQRQQGLQHRKNLAASAGMLFDYKRVQPVAMWMKNTL